MEGEQHWGGGKAGFLDIRRSAHSTKLCSVEELRESRKYIMGHVTFVHLRNFLLRFRFCLYRECFAMEKKVTHLWQFTKDWGEMSSFFKMLIVIVHACLSREEDICSSFFLKWKRSNCCCLTKKGPMIQTLSV